MTTTAAPALAVVGVAANRRVGLFADAARRAGLPPVRVLDWYDVLRGESSFPAGELVRFDAAGEDPRVDHLLRGLDEPTRVEGSARWYAGFTEAARIVGDRARAAGAVLLDDPAELPVLFDKRACHDRLRTAGVAVPFSPTSGPDAPTPRNWAEVRALLAEHHLTRAFVKLAHGSSASGVLAVETAPDGRVQATTSVERDSRGRLYNSLRVRRYRTEAEVAALIDTLAPDHLHIERWLPKATLGDRVADLRVVVIAGRATHAVVRTSRSPMTNLHLGGARGDLAAARSAIDCGGARWPEVLDLAERAAACFPGFSRVGVDILPARGWRRFAVGEVNAFGDLLPGLTGFDGGGAEDLDTYAAQIAALRAPAVVPR